MRCVSVQDTQRPGPSVTSADFPLCSEPVKYVKVVLDTAKVPGWNEIDAVELVGPDGRGWAVGARASSTFASY